MAQKKRSRKRAPLRAPPPLPRDSIIEESDRWHSVVLAEVEICLDEEKAGHVCITTPSGRACRVTIWFSPGGKA
jgi:hypothetical protein